MRILFIAPIPFFYERGACIRTRNIVTAAGKLGHEVDLLTYPVGENVIIHNVNILRVSAPFKPPLEAKMNLSRLITDFLLYRKASKMAEKKYDCIIGKTPIGRWIGRKIKEKTNTPLIIDVVEPALGMVQLYSRRKLFKGFFLSKIAKLAVRNPITTNFLRKFEEANYRVADLVLANWDLVAEQVRKESGKESYLLYDTLPDIIKKEPTGKNMREKYGIEAEEKVLLYTGAFTPQQGIDVYLNSLKRLKNKSTKLVLVGPPKERYLRMAEELGVKDKVLFTGQRPMEEMPDYFAMADVLLTAYNSGGLNATVKLLIYLFQKKPIVASDVLQYRQVISEEVAFLAEPTAEDFATKIDYVLDNPEVAEKIAKNAYKYSEKKFSEKAYLDKVNGVLDYIENLS